MSSQQWEVNNPRLAEFRECWLAGMSLRAMAAKFHISLGTVWKVSIRQGLPRRATPIPAKPRAVC